MGRACVVLLAAGRAGAVGASGASRTARRSSGRRRAWSAQPQGLCGLGTPTTSLPPGRVTRAISANTEAGRVLNSKTITATAASTLRSASGRRPASARTRHPGARTAAWSSIPASRSTPIACAAPASRCSKSRPVPQPTSSTIRQPGCAPSEAITAVDSTAHACAPQALSNQASYRAAALADRAMAGSTVMRGRWAIPRVQQATHAIVSAMSSAVAVRRRPRRPSRRPPRRTSENCWHQ